MKKILVLSSNSFQEALLSIFYQPKNTKFIALVDPRIKMNSIGII